MSDLATPRTWATDSPTRVKVSARSYSDRNMDSGGHSVGARRGRGRRESDPELLPPGMPYEDWRELHEPALEGILRSLEADEAEWERYAERCAAAVEYGLDAPPEPPPATSMWSCLRTCAVMFPARRAELVREFESRPHRAMPPLVPTAEGLAQFVAWIVGEAMIRGLACDYDSAYQVWFAVADLLLRDADIGAIIARVHPERMEGRSPRLTAEEIKDLNARLASAERKRVNKKRNAFGYSAA